MHKIFNLIINVFCLFFLTSCGGKAIVATTLVSEDYEADTSSVEECGTYEQSSEEASSEVVVYVCGAVNKPDVYTLSYGAIKQEALVAAGGFAEGAAMNYVNLAEKVQAGEKIYFPYEDELAEGRYPTGDEGTNNDGLININTADKDKLMTLPGIGEKRAQDILDYRELHGGFQSIEDIKNVKGIKDSIYNDIKDRICVR